MPRRGSNQKPSVFEPVVNAFFKLILLFLDNQFSITNTWCDKLRIVPVNKIRWCGVFRVSISRGWTVREIAVWFKCVPKFYGLILDVYRVFFKEFGEGTALYVHFFVYKDILKNKNWKQNVFLNFFRRHRKLLKIYKILLCKLTSDSLMYLILSYFKLFLTNICTVRAVYLLMFEVFYPSINVEHNFWM